MAIRTFNSGKKFSEEIIHPLISNHTNARLTTRFGAVSTSEASKFEPDHRIINRFNAMKERAAIQLTIITEIQATVQLNGNQSEMGLLTELKDQLRILENQFDERSEEIIDSDIVKGVKKPHLTPIFTELGNYLDNTYVHLQVIMTKNGLLFQSDNEEFLEDQELKEKIKSSNRSS